MDTLVAQPDKNHRGVVLQFHGCFWHGCPRCFRINRDNILADGLCMDDKYERTLATTEKLRLSNYKIFENGDVYSNFTKKFLKTDINNGYASVTLFINKKPFRIKVHRLVALLWLDENKENKCM